MRQTCVIAMIAAALVGCAPMIWDKAGGSQDEYNKDAYACERDSRQSGYFGGGFVGAMNMQDFFKRCMTSKGYILRPQ